MRAEIKRLHLAQRATTVYVTHDQVEAMAMGDRIVLTVDRAEAALGLIEQTLRQAGVTGVRIYEAEPGLEDIFVQIIRRQEG